MQLGFSKDNPSLTDHLKQLMKKSALYPFYRKTIFPLRAKYFVPKLLRVHIEPTNHCNLSCKVCYSQNPKLFLPRKKGFIEFTLYKQIIDELSRLSYTIDLGLNFGGESLLHHDFIEMMKYASSKGTFQIGFTTNGIMLSDEIINAIIDCRIDTVVISLDGIGEQHDSLRIGSKYENIKKKIEKLVIIRGSNSKPSISVNVTQSEQNSQSILRLVNQWARIVDNVKIYPCLSEELRFTDDTFFSDAPCTNSEFCYWPFNYMAILWNGDVTICCADINGVNIIGNVANHSISQIWRSNRYRQLRYDAATSGFPRNLLCYKCNSWKTRFISRCELEGQFKVTYSSYCKQYELATDF